MKKSIKIILTMFAVIAFSILFNCNSSHAANTTVNALRNKFPAGKFWNHVVQSGHNYYNGIEDSGPCNNPDGYTSSPCAYHDGTTAGIGQIDCNSFDGGQECAGFARKLYYDYYGTYARSVDKTYDKNSIKPGDVVRYSGDGAANGGHEVWVIGVDNEKLIVAECNWYQRCEISWDRWVTKSNINIQYIYPAPYSIDDNKDTEAPKLSDGQIVISSVTANSFKVRVKASDNVGIDYINVAAKAPNDSEFKPWTRMTLVNGYYEATINASDHNNQKGIYHVHCYAFDKAKNQTGFAFPDFVMGSTIANLGNFTARIVPKSSTGYAIGIDGNSSLSNISLKNKNIADNSQLWKFENKGNNKYKITNYTNSYVFDIVNGKDTNSTNVALHTSNNSNAERFYIMNYNGAYRIVPVSSVTAKALNIANNAIKSGSNIEIYDVKNANNNYQTFSFEKLNTNLNGLNQVNGTWYNFKNGVVDTSYTGLVQYNGSWFYVQKGILNWRVKTLVQYNGTWFYVNNSTVDWNYTGLCQYNGSWFYIQKGQLKWGVKTLVQYNGTWYYVNNSTIDWNYTGLCQYNGSWFYIQKGQLKWGVRTLVQYNGTWYYVNNSTIDWNFTGLCEYNCTSYYIQKGQLRWGYNGNITYNGRTYRIQNSMVSK